MKSNYFLIFLILLLLSRLVSAQIPNFQTFRIETESENKDSSGITTQHVDRFYLYTSSTINTTENLVSSLTGAQRFAAKWVIDPYTSSKLLPNYGFGFDALISMNVLHLKPNGINVDSVDLVSLMFPETGNAGFIFGPQFTWHQKTTGKSTHSYCSELSFSLRQNRLDGISIYDSTDAVSATESINFSVLNYNIMPFKYKFNYTPSDSFNTWFTVGPYFNFFNIPNEDADNFNRIFPEPIFNIADKGSFINSVGIKLSGGIGGIEFYADLRNNFTSASVPNDNPYKGFVFNIGFSTSLQILKR